MWEISDEARQLLANPSVRGVVLGEPYNYPVEVVDGEVDVESERPVRRTLRITYDATRTPQRTIEEAG